jgi:hypothetical protein
MGEGLADGISQGTASGSQFRTAPLWGVGRRIFFLHDGRSKDLLQAILAHGGEAGRVISNFNGLSPGQKQDILNFQRGVVVLERRRPRGDALLLANERDSLRSVDRGFVALSRASLQRHGIASTVESLPQRMFRIGLEIGHFDHHPIWSTAPIGADLYADPLS